MKPFQASRNIKGSCYAMYLFEILFMCTSSFYYPTGTIHFLNNLPFKHSKSLWADYCIILMNE